MILRNLSRICYISTLILSTALSQAQKTPDNFSFLEFSGSISPLKDDPAPIEKLVSSIVDSTLRPSFVIAAGDFTLAGRIEDYSNFKASISGLSESKVGFYALPGLQEMRSSPEGKEGFTKAFGKLYQSFEYGGAHFVLLDSTVTHEYLGHFDKAELDWLDRDLKRLKPDAPIFVFVNHAIGSEIPSARPIDNEYEMLHKLNGHNVMALFSGVGKDDQIGKINGITTLVSRGLIAGSYYKVSVTPLLVVIDRIYTKNPGPLVHLTLPISRRAKPSQLRAGWDDPDIPYLERRRPAATLEPRNFADNPDKEKGEYRLDDGQWKPLTKDARDIWRDVFLTKTLPVGIHTSDVRVTTSSNVTLSDELIFEVEREAKEPTRKWAIDLDGPIQSSPLLHDGVLYVSSVDNHVYALNPDSGKKRWNYSAKGAFLASPIIDGGTLYVGSTDHYFYALDSKNGKFQWKFDAGSPIFSTAAAAKGIVCFGVKGKIYGLDEHTGVPRWSVPVENALLSQAVTEGIAFYLLGQDGALYAVDTQNGSRNWTSAGARPPYYAPVSVAPAFLNGFVYSVLSNGMLYAYNSKSGSYGWSVEAPRGGDPFGNSPPIAIENGIIIAGTGPNGNVYFLNQDDGSVRWKAALGQPIVGSSAKLSPDGKSLAIMGVRGKVAVLNTASGKPIWGYELGPGNIFSAPEYDGRVVYTVTMANDVQAINQPGIGIIPQRKPTVK